MATGLFFLTVRHQRFHDRSARLRFPPRLLSQLARPAVGGAYIGFPLHYLHYT
jgi:hypothetical protein